MDNVLNPWTCPLIQVLRIYIDVCFQIPIPLLAFQQLQWPSSLDVGPEFQWGLPTHALTLLEANSPLVLSPHHFA